MKFFNLREKHADELQWDGPLVSLTTVKELAHVLGPDAKTPGHADRAPRVQSDVQDHRRRAGGEEDAVFLRPETAQGMFVNFKNVCDSTRVRIPFGIAQMGKSFRNEITPRNFTFRSREFEQMEIEFFCHPSHVARVVSLPARSPLPVVRRSRTGGRAARGCAITTRRN